jgi:hypothetical protein
VRLGGRLDGTVDDLPISIAASNDLITVRAGGLRGLRGLGRSSGSLLPLLSVAKRAGVRVVVRVGPVLFPVTDEPSRLSRLTGLPLGSPRLGWGS